MRLTVAITVAASNVAEALTAAWWVFRKAGSDDPAGWDTASAAADARPGEPDPLILERMIDKLL